MTVEPSYRIDKQAEIFTKGDRTPDILDDVQSLKDYGVLVPDTRLQAIADAYSRWQYLDARSLNIEVSEARVKLSDLLDALVKESKITEYVAAAMGDPEKEVPFKGISN